MESSFCVNPKTKQIDIYAGDTASMTVTLRGYDFQSTDRALFTMRVKDSDEPLISRLLEFTNNTVVVSFASEDTNFLDPDAEYEWDLRVIINPQYDENEEIITRDAVTTPGSPFKFVVHKTVGKKV